MLRVLRGKITSYKITGDSCLDLTEELEKDPHFQMIPLTLQVDGVQVIDDETFDQKKFLVMMKASPNCPRAACLSPEMFKEAYEYDAENIFVITPSSNLSGTYNSTVLAKRFYEEEYEKKNIAVIDSRLASSGELNIGLMIRDLCEQGMPFREVVEKAIQYTQHEVKAYFMLESLDTLRKNGRLSGFQAFFTTTLNIKPVMGADRGNIIELNQARGINKALVRVCKLAMKEAKNSGTLWVIVAHCNNEVRMQLVKEEPSKRAPLKEIIATGTTGVTTVYANDDGIILAL